jgi:hypothetical protein
MTRQVSTAATCSQVNRDRHRDACSTGTVAVVVVIA